MHHDTLGAKDITRTRRGPPSAPTGTLFTSSNRTNRHFAMSTVWIFEVHT